MNGCPQCGSKKIGGLVAAFWWPLDENGEPEPDPQGGYSWNSESEIHDKRVCYDCDHEWVIDE